ncbi:hypothetical protein glysoja_040277 [Glycine soja]|uniref:Uncharacterized protein n=1 Tax=Glycine soja TaxID=3848 RepID=A0A0B2PY38_GLYSO|nr:hypothetical protein glysoja_040277 [Glycine soja]
MEAIMHVLLLLVMHDHFSYDEIFEILHARWVTLAFVSAVIPKILNLLGAVHFVEPVWWRAGYSKLKFVLLGADALDMAKWQVNIPFV